MTTYYRVKFFDTSVNYSWYVYYSTLELAYKNIDDFLRLFKEGRIGIRPEDSIIVLVKEEDIPDSPDHLVGKNLLK
jgi:hypothetical protein